MFRRIFVIAAVFISLLLPHALADDAHAIPLYNQALDMLRKNDPQDAIRLAEQSLAQSSPKSTIRQNTYLIILGTYEKLRGFDKEEQFSRQALSEISSADPDYNKKLTDYLPYAGYAAQQQKHYDECLADYNRLLPLIPPAEKNMLAYSYENRGFCNMYTAHGTQATDDYQHALALFNALPDTQETTITSISQNMAFLTHVHDKDNITFLPGTGGSEHYNAASEALKNHDYGTADTELRQALAITVKTLGSDSGTALYIQDQLNTLQNNQAINNYNQYTKTADEAFRNGDKITAMNDYQQALQTLAKTGQLDSDTARYIQKRLADVQAIDNSDDYLNKVGFPVNRWRNRTKVLVYIEDGSHTDNWNPGLPDLMKKALAQWQAAVDNRITFEYSDKPSQYDVRIQWANGCLKDQMIDSSDPDMCVAGYNAYETWDRYIAKNDITISLTHKDGRPETPDDIYATMLHEAGHMMGIKGHSSNPADIMFSYNESDWKPLSTLSARDVATIQSLYHIHPGVINPRDYHLSQFNDFKDTVSATYQIDSGPVVQFEGDDDNTAASSDSDNNTDDAKKKKRHRAVYTNQAPIWLPGPGGY